MQFLQFFLVRQTLIVPARASTSPVDRMTALGLVVYHDLPTLRQPEVLDWANPELGEIGAILQHDHALIFGKDTDRGR